MVSKLQFYYAPGACSLAAHILLREAGLEFEGIPNEVGPTGARFTEGFSRINPKMRVPVLVVDGEAITENPAVFTAISGLAPHLQLLGKTTVETLRAYEWLNWLSGTLHTTSFSHFFRPDRFADDPSTYESVRSKARKNIKDGFDEIEGKLDSVFAVGDGLTVVDPFLLVFYRWGNMIQFDMRKDYPKYTALVSNLAERSSVKSALAIEKIESTL